MLIVTLFNADFSYGKDMEGGVRSWSILRDRKR